MEMKFLWISNSFEKPDNCLFDITYFGIIFVVLAVVLAVVHLLCDLVRGCNNLWSLQREPTDWLRDITHTQNVHSPNTRQLIQDTVYMYNNCCNYNIFLDGSYL